MNIFYGKLNGSFAKCATQVRSGSITLSIVARGPCAAAACAHFISKKTAKHNIEINYKFSPK